MSTSKLYPSYYGHIGSTKDALLIIQEIVDKQLELVPRRPHESERPSLIKSGNVFVFIEEHSGIKRWTDGIAWSPSRVLGRFLVYRELDKHSLSEKDDKKKKKRKISMDQDGTNHSSRDLALKQNAPSIPHAQQLLHQHDSNDYNANKNLLGTVVTSYVFKDQGLIKKTLSLTTTIKELHIEKREAKQTIHLISYYNAEDVLNGKLQRPSKTDLKNLTISNALWNSVKDSSLGGKIPIEDEAYYFLDTNYQLQNMSLLQHPSANQTVGAPLPNSHNQHHLQYSPQKYPVRSQQSKSIESVPPGFTRHNSHPPTHIGNQQYLSPSQQHQHSGSTDYSQYMGNNVKREDDNSNGANSNELTFNNPFAGTPHQSSFSYNSNSPPGNSGANSSSVSGPGTNAASIPLFNMMGPQQYNPRFSQPQIHQQNQQHLQDSSQISTNSSSNSYFPPFPQHYQKKVYNQQGQQTQQQILQQQQQPYHIGSNSVSNEQFAIGGMSNSSISSGGSSLAAGNSASNSFSGPPTSGIASKKNYRSNSGGNSANLNASGTNGSNGWFTTIPPIGSNGAYVSAPAPYSGDLSDTGVGLGAPLPSHLYHPTGSLSGTSSSGNVHPGTHHPFYPHPHPQASTSSGIGGSSVTLATGSGEEASNSNTRATPAAANGGPYYANPN